jgi:NADH-quinone oxidoreductase subunit L
MFVALGVGAPAVAVFHLCTHAFFKACLFLGAGSVIHALGGEQDIRRMGGLAKKIPVTFATFAVATAAIAGIPPLAGFFSKDEILWFAFASGSGGSPLLWVLASSAALLTAFYMFRLLWLVFLGTSRMDAEVAHHVHESPWSMTGVLLVLAALSALGGFIPIAHFLEPLLPLPALREGFAQHQTTLVVISVVLALAGLATASWVYGKGLARGAALATRFAPLHRLLDGKYFVDEAYATLLGRPLHWLSARVFLDLGDRRLLDGSLDGLASAAQRAAGRLGRIQSGSLQFYMVLAVAGAAASLGWMWWHG